MYVHVNPCVLEPISHAKTLNDQCEFVQYSVLESIFVAQEPHKFCSGSVRAKQVSARPSAWPFHNIFLSPAGELAGFPAWLRREREGI